MTAPRKRHRAEPASDYGPAQRLRNGTAVTGYRPDPDRPQGVDVQGARGQSKLDRLWAIGGVSTREWRAGKAYVDLAEATTGASDKGGQRVVVDGLARRFEPPERAIIAQTKMRHADARLGVDRNDVRDFLLQDVCGELTLPVLKQALVRLAIFFDIPVDRVRQT
jgi:hypothetical protein